MKKLKGSSESIKLRYVLFAFVAALLAALPLRVYQLIALVDVKTGFFTGSDGTVALLYMLAVVFVLLLLLLSYLSYEVPEPKLPTGKNKALGITALILAGSLVWDIVITLKSIVPAEHGSSRIFFGLLQNQTSQSGGLFAFLRILFAFLAVVYFIVFSTSHISGKGSYKEYKLLALSPLCWAISRLIICLRNDISFLKVSDLFFQIFMLVFLMLFFMTFARISSGVFTEDSMWGIYGYGFPAAFLAAIVSLPRFVMMLTAKGTVKGYGFQPCDLACLIFVMTYIFASLGMGFGVKTVRKKAPKTVPETTSETVPDIVFEKVSETAPETEENSEMPISDTVQKTPDKPKDVAFKKEDEKPQQSVAQQIFVEQIREDQAAETAERPEIKHSKLFGKKEKPAFTDNEIEMVPFSSIKNAEKEASEMPAASKTPKKHEIPEAPKTDAPTDKND